MPGHGHPMRNLGNGPCSSHGGPLPIETIRDELLEDPFAAWAASPALSETDLYRLLWGLGEWFIRAWSGAIYRALDGLQVASLISRGRSGENLLSTSPSPGYVPPGGPLTSWSLEGGKYTGWAARPGFFPSRLKAVLRSLGRFSHFMKDGGDALEALDSLRSLYQACRPGVHGLAGAPLRPPLSWEMEDYSSKMPSRTSWRDWFAAQQEDLVCEELALAPSDKFWQPSESFVIFSSSAHHPRLGVAIKGCSCPKGEGGFDMRVEIDEGTPHRLWTSAVLFLERFHGLFIRVSFKEGLRLVVPTELWFRCVRRWREA